MYFITKYDKKPQLSKILQDAGAQVTDISSNPKASSPGEAGMTEGRAAVLVDRDDTLCPDVPHNGDPAKMHVFPYVPEAVRRLNDAGFLVLVVTNQSGIGRGMYTVDDMMAVNAEMERQIAVGGGRIDDVFFCPHRPDEACDCRKPKVGMGLQAIRKYGLDVSRCYMVGDKDKDVQFGESLGIKSYQVSGTFTFADAVDEILRDFRNGN